MICSHKRQCFKRVKQMLFVLVFVFVSAVSVQPALAVDAGEYLSDAADLSKLEDSIPESAKKNMSGLKVMDSLELQNASDTVKRALQNEGESIFKSALKSGYTIIITVMLCSLGEAISYGGNEKVKNCTSLAATAVIMTASLGNIKTFIGLGATLLDEINTFSKTLLPTIAASAAASGAITSSSAKYAVSALFMDILITAFRNIIVPLIYGYAAASMAGAAFGKAGLKSAADLIKWAVTTIMTLLVGVFTAYLGLTGLISSTTDATAAKITKTAISALPVVGGIISDAAGTVAGAASMLKNAVGIFGFTAICAVCIVPILKLLSHYIVYKGTAALVSSVAEDNITKLLESMSTAFGMILGAVGASVLMFFISVLSSLKAVNI